MLFQTNSSMIQNGFHAQTFQARIAQNVSEWYILFLYIIDTMLSTI